MFFIQFFQKRQLFLTLLYIDEKNLSILRFAEKKFNCCPFLVVRTRQIIPVTLIQPVTPLTVDLVTILTLTACPHHIFQQLVEQLFLMVIANTFNILIMADGLFF